MDETVDWDYLTKLVHIAGIAFIRDDDWEDLAQEGLIVAWQYHTMPRALLITIIRRRMIDIIRQWRGRTNHSYGQPGRRRPTITPVGTTDSLNTPHASLDPADQLSTTLTLDLRGRLAVIAEALEAGETKQSVADQLGLHPSRISQLLPEIKAKWTDSQG